MLLLMAGLAAVTAAAARSASSLRETVLLGAAATATSHNMCGAFEIEHDDANLPPLSKPTAQHVPSITSTSTPCPPEPTEPTNACNDSQLIVLQLSTMLISNAITRRQDHAKHLVILASQHAAHQTEVLRLRQDMELARSNLQDQLDDLRKLVETMQRQKEEEAKKQKPSVREYMISSSDHLRDHLHRMLADLSNTRTEQQVAFIAVPVLLIIAACLLIKKYRSKRTRTNHNVSNYRYHHPTSPISSPNCIPKLSTADSCSSPSLGSHNDHGQTSPSTPCPPYIAIPAVQRRMTTAKTIEQMARDADAKYPHAGGHLPLPPPPLIPSLCQEDTTSKSSLDTAKSESALKRKARILSRRLTSMTRKVRRSPAIRFFLRISFLFLLAAVIIKIACLNWKSNEFVPLTDLPQPLGFLIELVITFSVFLAAGYRLSFGPSNKSTISRDAARAAIKRSTIRRHRSLIRGPSTVRSGTSSNSRSAVFRRQRRPSKRSLFSRSRLE